MVECVRLRMLIMFPTLGWDMVLCLTCIHVLFYNIFILKVSANELKKKERKEMLVIMCILFPNPKRLIYIAGFSLQCQVRLLK